MHRGVEETAAVVAGMLGFTINIDDTEEVSVQPFQGWSLLLFGESPFLKGIAARPSADCALF